MSRLIAPSMSRKSTAVHTTARVRFARSEPRPAGAAGGSVELEGILVVDLQRRILRLLGEQAVADGERLDVAAHEAAEGVFGRAHDRFAANVEAGVDQHR